jgi:hypothetical protein
MQFKNKKKEDYIAYQRMFKYYCRLYFTDQNKIIYQIAKQQIIFPHHSVLNVIEHLKNKMIIKICYKGFGEFNCSEY